MGKKKGSSGDNYKYIPIEIILQAMQNEEPALEYILERYQTYINKLASYRVRNSNGRYFTVLDEDQKQQIEEALILAIRQFKIR